MNQNPKPTNTIELLCSAIATQEGAWHEVSTPYMRNNPGDILYAGQLGATCPRCGSKNGGVPSVCTSGRGGVYQVHDKAVFDSRARGVVALYRQVLLMIDEGLTPRQIIDKWSETDKAAYIANVLLWTGLDGDTPMIQLVTPLCKLD